MRLIFFVVNRIDGNTMTQLFYVNCIEFAKYSILNTLQPNPDPTTRKIILGTSEKSEHSFQEIFLCDDLKVDEDATAANLDTSQVIFK